VHPIVWEVLWGEGRASRFMATDSVDAEKYAWDKYRSRDVSVVMTPRAQGNAGSPSANGGSLDSEEDT
jgi:hypothetical protein